MANIAYIGNFEWRHCTEVHAADAFRMLGHTVTRLQENEVTAHDIETAAKTADLLLFTRTWGCHDPTELHALFRRVEAAGTVTASYHLDLYVGLDREHTISGDPFWGTEHVFHPDGHPLTDRVLRQHGINHHVLPPAVAANECFPGSPQPEFDHRVTFVGSALPYGHTTEWPFRDRLVRHLHSRFAGGFAHYGPGGRRTVRNGLTGRGDNQLNDLYASARVTVGDSIDRDGYVSDRLIETLGRGGLLVFPRVTAAADMGYRDGVHYIGYTPGDLASLDAAVDKALGLNDQDRLVMRLHAIAHTAARHTFKHRMALLLAVAGIRTSPR